MGSRYTDAPRFSTDWNNIQAPNPTVNILLNSFFDVMLSRKKR